jgi:tRNA nucleotidyltransferase/poly(A) polymerase
VEPNDIDLATTATTDEMIEMFTKENVIMLNKGAIKHGTIRVRSHNQSFEISTMRNDAADRGKRENDENWKGDAQQGI